MKDEDKTRAQLIAELQNLRTEYERACQRSAGPMPGAEVFHKIVEHASDAIISMNASGTIVLANRKAEELYGYGAGEMLGKSSSDLIPEDSRASEGHAVARHCRHLSSGHLASLKEGTGLRKNGDTFPVEASYYGYQLNGEYFMTGILRDISERQKIEWALEEAKDFSDNIIESSVDSIVITNANGTITRINSAFLKLLEFEKKEQVVGQYIEAFSPDHEGEYETTTGEHIQIGLDYFKAMKRAISLLQKGEKLALLENYHLRADNKIVPVEDTISPLFDKTGAIIGAVGVIRDITDRKRVERQMSDSRDFYVRLFDTSMEGLVVSDAQGYITMVNHKAAAMLDYTKEELIGQHFGSLGLTLSGEKEKALKIIEEFLTRGEIIAVERIWKRKDGSTIDVEMNIYKIKDAAGNTIGAMASFRDIGPRKKADTALRVSEERYRRIFENSFVALQEVDISRIMSHINDLKSGGMRNFRQYLTEHPEVVSHLISMGHPININQATLKLYGAKDEKELIASSDKLWRKASPTYREVLIALSEGKGSFEAESVVHTLQGGDRDILLQINFLVKQRNLNRILVSIIDITQVKAAEKKLLEYHQQLRSLTHELITKEENERRTLGMYLHDRIGQSLSALKMQLAMMAAELTGSDERKKCDRMLAQIEKTLHDTRVLSYELSPVILHELGLEVAVGWLTEQTQKRHNIAVSFKRDKKARQFDDSIKITLYRAVSELLHNVVKHARADNAAVSMKARSGQLHITVEDNGVGFDPSEIEGVDATERGFGLFSMRERLHYLGGSVHIKSARNKGTRITLIAPLK